MRFQSVILIQQNANHFFTPTVSISKKNSRKVSVCVSLLPIYFIVGKQRMLQKTELNKVAGNKVPREQMEDNTLHKRSDRSQPLKWHEYLQWEWYQRRKAKMKMRWKSYKSASSREHKDNFRKCCHVGFFFFGALVWILYLPNICYLHVISWFRLIALVLVALSVELNIRDCQNIIKKKIKGFSEREKTLIRI